MKSTSTDPLVWAEISAPALAHNIAVLKQQVGHARLYVVVKANAYGHGMLEIATILATLNQVHGFAVARLDEAEQLRSSGITQPIMVMSGIQTLDDLALCATLDLEAVIHHEHLLSQMANILPGHSAMPQFWLKLNTGMNRLGMTSQNLIHLFTQNSASFATYINNCCKGFMSHFASAEDVNASQTQQQINALSPIKDWLEQQHIPLKLCLANSAAVFYFEDYHLDAVRAGIASYGINPNPDDAAIAEQLQPVMRLKAKVIALHHCKAGESIGYNATFVTQRDSLIATVSAGYADGYPRHAPSGTPVWINGQKAALAGRVSMDMLAIDVTDIDVKLADTVELWGENIPCELVAKAANTIAYELLVHVSDRVPRLMHY